MRMIAMLANHAEVSEGRLFISAGGWDQVPVQPGSSGPWMVSCALALLIKVPWTDTNRQHALAIDFVDEDDRPVPLGDGSGSLHVEFPFSAGRDASVTEGSEQNVSMAINFAALPVANLGAFNFRLQIDGETVERVPLHLFSPPQPQFGLAQPSA